MNTSPRIVMFVLCTFLCFTIQVGDVSGAANPVSERRDLSSRFSSVTVDPRVHRIELYWKNDDGTVIGSIDALLNQAQKYGKRLTFAMNAGMFHADLRPVGLLVQNKVVQQRLNIDSGTGNFFLKPNGVFYLTTRNRAVICKTENMPRDMRHIRAATQSGPLLLIDGHVNSAFNSRSSNVNIRNGVGVLPNGHVVFAISNVEVTFYELAEYFRQRGCSSALYLDGYVSRMYAPSIQRTETEGELGPIIGIME